jgi:hypothetical protein
MSSADISSGLIDGVYDVLNGNVTIGGVTYDVYKTVYMGQTNRAYVYVGNIVDTENGTKEDFIFEGSIAIESVDEQQTSNVSRSTVQAINNKVRSLLKTTRTEVPTVSGHTVIYFKHGGSTMTEEKARDGRTRYRIIDIYEFLIQ